MEASSLLKALESGGVIEVEICLDQRRKLELVAAHRQSDIAQLRDIGDGKFVALIRKR